MKPDDFSTPTWLFPFHTRLGSATSWRDVSIGGAYVPMLMLLFVGCALLTWLIDLLIAKAGGYRYIWHPPLFRVSLFTCLFAAVSLTLYG